MLHDEGIALFWPGIEPVAKYEIINLNLLESSVNQPFQTVFGEDAYPTIEEKAACLFHGLIANHCFHNGNKRTGVLALDQFLYANEYMLTLQNEDMYNLARFTASYREQSISSKEMQRLISRFIAVNIVPFSALEATQPKFHANCVEWMTDIRDNPLNAENAVTDQAKITLGLRR